MSKQNCRIAAVQMVSGPRVAENLATAGRLVADAVARARLVVLPEYFPIIGAIDADRVRAGEQFGDGPIQAWLAETARRHDIWLFAGSIPLAASTPDKMRNSSLVFNPAGECVKRYDKIHLFGFSKGDESYDEASFIEPAISWRRWIRRSAGSPCRFAMTCAFPELYRALAPVDLILVPAAFTETTGRALGNPAPRGSRTNAICSLSDRRQA